jgi:hypothetical protein
MKHRDREVSRMEKFLQGSCLGTRWWEGSEEQWAALNLSVTQAESIERCGTLAGLGRPSLAEHGEVLSEVRGGKGASV